jgi:flagellar biosynthesis protein FlhA
MKGMGKLAVPIGVVAIVLMLVVPLPAACSTCCSG